MDGWTRYPTNWTRAARLCLNIGAFNGCQSQIAYIYRDTDSKADTGTKFQLPRSGARFNDLYLTNVVSFLKIIIILASFFILSRRHKCARGRFTSIDVLREARPQCVDIQSNLVRCF